LVRILERKDGKAREWNWINIYSVDNLKVYIIAAFVEEVRKDTS
jgi:hypothetical protein